MRDSSLGLAILLTFAWASPASADYIIRLKNGRTVETARVWEEKGEIKFQWPGGVASLPRKDLLTITEVEKKFPDPPPDRIKQPESGKPETPPELPAARADFVERVSPAERSPSSEGSRDGSAELARRRRARYLEQFERAYQRYLEASSRRDGEGKKKAWEEFNRFGGQVIALEEELKKKNNGTLPPWWKEETAKSKK